MSIALILDYFLEIAWNSRDIIVPIICEFMLILCQLSLTTSNPSNQGILNERERLHILFGENG